MHEEPSAFVALVMLAFQLGIAVLMIASFWKILVKAGVPGWWSLIPFANMYQALKIAGYEGGALIGMFVGMFIPFINFIVLILWGVKLAERFGKGVGFGIGIGLLGIVFLPILAFGDADYN